jgi:adenylylsulfate kinase
MPIAKPDPEVTTRGPGFAVWITGLPASGKSTIAEHLISRLRTRGIDCARLESDALRNVMSGMGYSSHGRDVFYETLSWIGKLLTDHGVPVVIDATANRRRYRDAARQAIVNFVEVYVDTPLDVCMERDPKGLYRRGKADRSNDLPGLGAGYEPPRDPEITVSGVDADPSNIADRVIDVLVEKGFVPGTVP